MNGSDPVMKKGSIDTDTLVDDYARLVYHLIHRRTLLSRFKSCRFPMKGNLMSWMNTAGPSGQKIISTIQKRPVGDETDGDTASPESRSRNGLKL